MGGAVIALCVTMGVTGVVALHHFFLWLGRRSLHSHLWVAGLCVGALLYQLARLWHYLSSSAEGAINAMRLEFTAVFCLACFFVGVVRAFARLETGALAWALIIGHNAALVALCWWTSLFVTDSARLWTDPAGQTYYWVDLGPAHPLWLVYGAAYFAYCARVLWRAKIEDPWERRLMLGGFAIYLAFGVHDVLIGLGLTTSVVIFEHGFAALVVCFSYVPIRRLHRSHEDLEARVRDRTRELEHANDALRAAVRTASDAAEEKAQLLAHMSHEIRTPMNGVLGMTELLLETELDDDRREMVETMRASGQALLRILDDILGLSKLEAGKVVFDFVELDLPELVEDVAALFAPAAASKGVDLVAAVPRSLQCAVVGDAVRIRQVLSNLVSNAVKFTDTGAVILGMEEVGVDSTESNGGGDEEWAVRFSVTDSGEGIAPSDRQQIFAPFTQSDANTGRKGGTGLGLAIARELVEAMGGHIGVDSAEGGGSTFWFVLPFADRSSLPPASILPGASPTGRVLVVHPQQRVAAAYERMILSYGLEVRSEAGAPGGWDAVLADESALAASSEAEPTESVTDRGEVPLVLLCSAGFVGSPEDDDVHADLRLLKPCRSERLVDALLRVIGGEAYVPSQSQRAEQSRGKTSEPGTSPSRQSGGELAGLRVLVAEDDPVNQLVARRMLCGLGCECAFAQNGREAVCMLTKAPFDLVLMDCQMPELDGFGATREIRKSEEPRVREVPIVAFTAAAMEGDRSRCLDAGMNGYVSKPVQLSSLKEALASVLPGNGRARRPRGPRQHERNVGRE